MDFTLLTQVFADFTTFVSSLSTAKIDAVNETSQFYSFYINVYNALAVAMIVNNPCEKDLFGTCGPIKSIRDIGINYTSIDSYNQNLGTILPWKTVWDMNAGGNNIKFESR